MRGDKCIRLRINEKRSGDKTGRHPSLVEDMGDLFIEIKPVLYKTN